MSSICERCGKEQIENCQNGQIINDDESARTCPDYLGKRRVQLLRERLGTEVSGAETILESPLYVPPKTKGETEAGPQVDYTNHNLFITGTTWKGFLPHLKLVLLCNLMKTPNFTFKIVNDWRLKEVFVGNESYRNTPVNKRETKETNNSIGDIAGDPYDLVIIRLGVLGHKNAAAAGLLKEILLVREALDKPTWLFESTDYLNAWKHSRDDEVAAYVEKYFETVRIESKGASDDDDYGISVDDFNTEVKPIAEQPNLTDYTLEDEGTTVDTHPVSEPDPDLNLALPGEGRPKKFKKKWGR